MCGITLYSLSKELYQTGTAYGRERQLRKLASSCVDGDALPHMGCSAAADNFRSVCGTRARDRPRCLLLIANGSSVFARTFRVWTRARVSWNAKFPYSTLAPTRETTRLIISLPLAVKYQSDTYHSSNHSLFHRGRQMEAVVARPSRRRFGFSTSGSTADT